MIRPTRSMVRAFLSRRRLAAGVVAGLVLVPNHAQAQTFRQPDVRYQGILLQASAALVFPLGSEFDLPAPVDIGPGVEGLARWVFPNMISAGAGIRYSWHDIQGFSQNAQLLSLFGQIGYTFIFQSTPIRPTLGGRVGWTSYENPAGTRSGLDVGAFGGAELPLSETVALNGTLTFNFLVLEQLPGNQVDRTAQLFAIEAGVVIIP
jgi:hypothetical protein